MFFDFIDSFEFVNQLIIITIIEFDADAPKWLIITL